MVRKTRWLAVLSICLLATSACSKRSSTPKTAGIAPTPLSSGTTPTPKGDSGHSPVQPGPVPLGDSLDGPRACVALRGNGPSVTAHFASLARLVEHFGLFDGMAGGSSSTITMFIYESILQNPELVDCPNCKTDLDRALRASLLLKSIYAYIEVVNGSEESSALTTLMGLSKKATWIAEVTKLESLLRQDPPQAAEELKAWTERVRQAIRALVESKDLKAIVNPEFVRFALEAPIGHEVERFREVRDELGEFGAFVATDPRILYRPGIFSFRALSRLFSRVADFYAGRGDFYDHAAMRDFMDACAAEGQGLDWHALVAKDPSCRERALKMMQAYRANRVKADEATFPARYKDAVGEKAHLLVSAAIFEEPAEKIWQKAQSDYLSGRAAAQLKIYDQMRVGYWGQPADTRRLLENRQGYTDTKTTRTMDLGPTTWENALTYSPAEPNLARLQEVQGTKLLSGAGWADLHPVQALKNLGCGQVIYDTRWGRQDSTFAIGVGQLLGATDADNAALHDLKNPNSSFSLALKAADGVWCTDWDSYGDLQLEELDDSSFNAWLESPSQSLGTHGFPTYPAQTAPKTWGCGGDQDWPGPADT